MTEETEDQKLLRESLERWRENRPTYRKIALEIMAGKRSMDPDWASYTARYVQAEIGKIRQEREDAAKVAKAVEAKKTERREAERADKDWLL